MQIQVICNYYAFLDTGLAHPQILMPAGSWSQSPVNSEGQPYCFCSRYAFRELPVLLHTALVHSFSQLHRRNRSECSVHLRLMDTCVACGVPLSQTVLRCASPPVFPDSVGGFHQARWSPSHVLTQAAIQLFGAHVSLPTGKPP